MACPLIKGILQADHSVTSIPFSVVPTHHARLMTEQLMNSES